MRAILGWLALLAVVSAAMVLVRDSLEKTHVTLAFLLLVLGASATTGRVAGLAVAVGAFLLFNFLFLPPYYTLVIANPLDWLVLFVFLATAAVAAELLTRFRRKADEAGARQAEVERLAVLGAEAVSVPRADTALARVADVIRASLPVAQCVVHRVGDARGDDLVLASLERSTAFAVLPDGTTRPLRSDPGVTGEWRTGAPEISTRLLLPLRVRGTTVGVLELAEPRGFSLDAAQQRLLDAMAFYAALGVERVRLEADASHVAALQEADRLKNALIASVSHDLRTPLTTIKALAHGLQAHGDERAEIIEQEADRLNRFVGDLLDLSRIAAGGLQLTVEPVPVDDLVSAAVQQAEGALGAGRLSVSIAPGDPLLVGRFDLVHSIRILVNLLENAAKYAPAGSPIDLTARREGAWVDIEVADRGPGVPPAEADRVFQPLYRPADAPPDRGSAGLGLAIARQFAEAQDGTLTYTTRPGGGSVFRLRLPAVDLELLGPPENAG